MSDLTDVTARVRRTSSDGVRAGMVIDATPTSSLHDRLAIATAT